MSRLINTYNAVLAPGAMHTFQVWDIGEGLSSMRLSSRAPVKMEVVAPIGVFIPRFIQPYQNYEWDEIELVRKSVFQVKVTSLAPVDAADVWLEVTYW